MSNVNKETITDIVADIRAQNQGLPEDDYALSPLVADLLSFADRIESAHKREMADEKRISDAVVQSLRDKKLEMAGEIAEKEAEIAKLRECMKEAIREKCPFTRMSCKHGETCDYECGTFKWRKALQDEGGADALFFKRKDKQC